MVEKKYKKFKVLLEYYIEDTIICQNKKQALKDVRDMVLRDPARLKLAHVKIDVRK